MMDPNKKRVSFSHTILPHVRHISDSSSSSSSSTVNITTEIGLEPIPNEPRSPPPSFKAVEAFKIINNNTVEPSLPISDNTKTILKKLPSSNFSAFKFLETRRRSHAFSVSAIDETLPVNMDGEYYENYDNVEYVDDENVEHDGGNNKRKNRSPDHHQSEKFWRAAEIPISGTNRILICQTKNELITAKSFQHEIRGLKDLDWFLARPNIILNCECGSSKDVFDQILQQFDNALPKHVIDEVRNQLYVTKDEAFQLCNVIQNVYRTEDNQYLYDPTWFCT